MIKKEIYIFDCFNTLLYIDDTIERNWNAEIAKYLGIDKLVVKRMRRQSEKTVSMRHSVGEYEFNEMLHNFWERYESLIGFTNNAVLFSDFSELAFKEESNDLYRITMPNLRLKKEIETLANMGKKTVVLSDFYLGSDYLRKLLSTKLGGDLFKDIIVSCDWGMNKSSGTIYEMLIKQGYNPKQCLMTGDNFRSDYLRAKMSGFGARLWIKKK